MKEIRDSATAHGVELTIKMETPPPELDDEHYLVKASDGSWGVVHPSPGGTTRPRSIPGLRPA
jgi:hypothetical protein